MPVSRSDDPRSIRSRKAFQQAFTSLLETKPYHRITVTDIAREAGFARHTFYNHYETREDLLHSLIDTYLDSFFSHLDDWDFSNLDFNLELNLYKSFFQIWYDNPEIVKVLRQIDYDAILVHRLTVFFTNFFYDRIVNEIPQVEMELAKYVINFNAYSLIGILKPWLKDGMSHPPEVMAGFLAQLIGAPQRMNAVEEYKHIIR